MGVAVSTMRASAAAHLSAACSAATSTVYAVAPQAVAAAACTATLYGVGKASQKLYQAYNDWRYETLSISLVENGADFCALVYFIDSLGWPRHARLARFSIQGVERALYLPQKALWVTPNVHVTPGKECPASRDSIDTLTLASPTTGHVQDFLQQARVMYEAMQSGCALQYQWDGKRWRARRVDFCCDLDIVPQAQAINALSTPCCVLIEGVPGAGKSTAVRAAAHQRQIPIYVLPGNVEDSELVKAMALVRSPCILLMDNWDQLGRDRKLTKGAILNILDSRHPDVTIAVCVNLRLALEGDIRGIFRPGRVQHTYVLPDRAHS